MFNFGFELEGWEVELEDKIILPKETRTTDAFPGLIEIRTHQGQTLKNAYFDLLKRFSDDPFNTSTHKHTFTPDQKRILRKKQTNKSPCEINNIYSKTPKALNNSTIASLQINFSKLKDHSYHDKEGKYHETTYSLFDFIPIIKNLDNMFLDEILKSNRQPGWYSIKDSCRVEYRSLPCSVFETNLSNIRNLLNKINQCFPKD